MGLGIDGEFYDLRNATKIHFEIDKECPKLKVLKRMDYVDPNL